MVYGFWGEYESTFLIMLPLLGRTSPRKTSNIISANMLSTQSSCKLQCCPVQYAWRMHTRLALHACTLIAACRCVWLLLLVNCTITHTHTDTAHTHSHTRTHTHTTNKHASHTCLYNTSMYLNCLSVCRISSNSYTCKLLSI